MIPRFVLFNSMGWVGTYLPMIVPSLVTVAVLTFMSSWEDFMGALLYLNKPETYTCLLYTSDLDTLGCLLIEVDCPALVEQYNHSMAQMGVMPRCAVYNDGLCPVSYTHLFRTGAGSNLRFHHPPASPCR